MRYATVLAILLAVIASGHSSLYTQVLSNGDDIIIMDGCGTTKPVSSMYVMVADISEATTANAGCKTVIENKGLFVIFIRLDSKRRNVALWPEKSVGLYSDGEKWQRRTP